MKHRAQTKVLVVSESFPTPIDPYNGIFIARQVHALAEHADVAVIAPLAVPWARNKFAEERRLKQAVPRHECLGKAVVYRPRFYDFPRWNHYLNAYSMLATSARCIAQQRMAFDLIHSHFVFPGGYVGALLGRFFNKPTICTAHGYSIRVWAENPRTAEDKLITRAIRYTLERASSVIAVSDELASRIAKISPQAKVHVVGNGVDTTAFHPEDQSECRCRLGLPQNIKTIVFVGTLTQIKGLTHLLEAVSLIGQMGETVKLVLVGNGPLRKFLENRAQELGINDKIVFAGRQTPERIPLWVNASDAIVLPSEYESFGCVLLEALACGKPVAASRVGGIRDFVQDGVHGRLVTPGESLELAHAILSVLEDRWERESLLGTAMQNSWDVIAHRLLRQYDEVLRPNAV